MEKLVEGFILDMDSQDNKLRLYIKDKKNFFATVKFQHYLYLVPEDPKQIDRIRIALESDDRVLKVEEVEKLDHRKNVDVLKVYPVDQAAHNDLRKELRQVGKTREEDIPIVYRFLIDNDYYPLRFYDFKIKDDKIVSMEESGNQGKPNLKLAAFDIETWNKDGLPKPEKDPIIIIGYKDDSDEKTFYYTPEKGSEKDIMENFVEEIREKGIETIVGYNSGGFDFPYMIERAKRLRVDFNLGVDKTPIHTINRGIIQRADVFGRVHLDAYRGVEFLTISGALRLPRNDIDSVYKELFGKDKIEIDAPNMWKMWEDGGKSLETLLQYNKEDVTAAYEIGKELLPLYIELSKIVGLPLYEVSRMGTAQVVEWMLVREAYRQNILVPKRPSDNIYGERKHVPIEGAFVKEPEAGLHENVVVCDFRSLYPSLIVSYNIDPDSLNCECCKEDGPVSPKGHRFCKRQKGLIPKIIEDVLDTRIKIKEEMKKHKKGTSEYRTLHFKQWALKIVANSAYGYLGYPRGKWYSRECAESTTSWARDYIHKTMDAAKKAGFHVLYADTDSTFLKLGDKTVEDAKKFVEQYNKDLPSRMELEIQGYYPRAIFVTAKSGEAAKKRYALIRDDGAIEIKGFEFVRGDWSNIARKAQEAVINAVLHEGDPKKAAKAVEKYIKELRARKVSLKDIIIVEQITRKLTQYQQIGPHVKAAQRLHKAGYKIMPGTMVEYIVTEGSGSISDRAVPVQLLENKRYDIDYYIDNQILPATMKILGELGVKAEDLKHGGKQAALEKWS
jgi:DNA polymerase I